GLPRSIATRGLRDRNHPRGQALQGGQRRLIPRYWSNQDRDHNRLLGAVSCQRPCHLLFPAIIRVKEMGANETQYDVGLLDSLVDLPTPVAPGQDESVVP